MHDTMNQSTARRFPSPRALVITLALLASVVMFPLDNSSAEAATSCRAWTFIGIPGSKQGRAHATGTSDVALYGTQVAVVKQEFVRKRGASNVALYPINYPATLGPSYFSSVSKGVTETKRIISTVARACPTTKFVIAGYSQGAHVATDTLGSFPVASSRLHRVGLMGNPRFRDGSVNSVEVPAGSIGQNGLFNGGATWLSTWNGKVRDVCIDKDWTCEAGSRAPGTHGQYTTRAYPNSTFTIAKFLGQVWLGGG